MLLSCFLPPEAGSSPQFLIKPTRQQTSIKKAVHPNGLINPASVSPKRSSGLLHKLRLQLHRTDSRYFTIDIVISLDQADILHFGSDLNH